MNHDNIGNIVNKVIDDNAPDVNNFDDNTGDNVDDTGPLVTGGASSERELGASDGAVDDAHYNARVNPSTSARGRHFAKMTPVQRLISESVPLSAMTGRAISTDRRGLRLPSRGKDGLQLITDPERVLAEMQASRGLAEMPLVTAPDSSGGQASDFTDDSDGILAKTSSCGTRFWGGMRGYRAPSRVSSRNSRTVDAQTSAQVPGSSSQNLDSSCVGDGFSPKNSTDLNDRSTRATRHQNKRDGDNFPLDKWWDTSVKLRDLAAFNERTSCAEDDDII